MSTYTNLIDSEYNNLLNEFDILLTFLPTKVTDITNIINVQTSTWDTAIENSVNNLTSLAAPPTLQSLLQTEVLSIQSGNTDPSLSQLLNQYNYGGMLSITANVFVKRNVFLDLCSVVVPPFETIINNNIIDSNLLSILELLRQYSRYLTSLDIFNIYTEFSLYETSLVNAGTVTSPQTANIANSLCINNFGIDFNKLCVNNININSGYLQNCFYLYLEKIELNWTGYENIKSQYQPDLQ